MNESKQIKRPLNPYYLIGWYLLFLFCVATYIINAPTQSVGSLYWICQRTGMEDFLLMINRPYRIHEFLLEKGDVDRWQRIAVYFSVILSSLFTFSVFFMSITPRYLRDLAGRVESWSKPLGDLGWRAMRYMLLFGLFLCSAYIFMFCVGYARLHVVPRFASAIQLLNSSYFSEALNAAIFCFGLAALQFRHHRINHNRMVVAQLQQQGGKQ